jgi:putative DNA primase/helicase
VSVDFNDVYRTHGSAAVRARIEEAAAPGTEPVTQVEAHAASSVVTARLWRDPEPLTDQHTAFPYPVDALPSLLREAVLEVHAFVQAPHALVAASALASLSVAAQGLVNVRRDAQLVGPVSVYLLSVADSGERKSTCDAIFARPLREWELERREAMAADVTAAEAAVAAFEAKKAGLLDAIKVQRRKGKDAEEPEQQLRALVADAPRPVLRPRLLYSDATPEALAFSLGNGWPSGAVLSAEAGAVFGSWRCSTCCGTVGRWRSTADPSHRFSCEDGGSPSG